MTATAARIQTDVEGRMLRPAWELRWWQLWSRAWSQYEIHLGLYRILRKQPGDMSCLPPLALRPLIWSLSALAAVGDQHGTWLTNGHASVKLRPVNPRHGRIAQLIVWPTTVALYAICIATALAFGLSPWVVLALMIGVVIPPLVGIYTIHDSNRRAAGFATPLDMISAELVRHHRAPRGAGAALRDDVHSLANANQLIIGGVAASN